MKGYKQKNMTCNTFSHIGADGEKVYKPKKKYDNEAEAQKAAYKVNSAEKTITKVTLSFASGDGSNEITTDVGTFASPDWTGSSTAVEFTIGGTSGHRRIAKIEVTLAAE